MSSKIYHIYGFESPEFYVHIKATNYFEAIRKFCKFFGRDSLRLVEHINSSESRK